MNYQGPYPYLIGSDQLADIATYSQELANLLDAGSASHSRSYSGGDVSVPATPGGSWANIPTLSRLDVEIPGKYLCSLTFSIEATAPAGSGVIYVAPRFATELAAFGDPGDSHTGRSQVSFVPNIATRITVTRSFDVVASGRTSIRLGYLSFSTPFTVRGSEIRLTPIRPVL